MLPGAGAVPCAERDAKGERDLVPSPRARHLGSWGFASHLHSKPWLRQRWKYGYAPCCVGRFLPKPKAKGGGSAVGRHLGLSPAPGVAAKGSAGRFPPRRPRRPPGWGRGCRQGPEAWGRPARPRTPEGWAGGALGPARWGGKPGRQLCPPARAQPRRAGLLPSPGAASAGSPLP